MIKQTMILSIVMVGIFCLGAGELMFAQDTQNERYMSQRKIQSQPGGRSGLLDFDANKDSKLNDEERTKYLRASNDEYQALLRLYDFNADGELSEAELEQARVNTRIERLQVLMLTADENADGEVDVQERISMYFNQISAAVENNKLIKQGENANVEIPPAMEMGLIYRFDRDGSGSLDEEENKVFVEAKETLQLHNNEMIINLVDSLLLRFDEDESGLLDENEMVEAANSMERRFQERLKSGRLDADERAMVGMATTNSDIDPEE